MPKMAISVTLKPDNLIWLRAQALAMPGASVSEVIDRVVTEARCAGRVDPGSIQSVIGMIQIPEDDPDLRKADRYVKELVTRSLNRTARQLRGGKVRGKRHCPQRRRPRG